MTTDAGRVPNAPPVHESHTAPRIRTALPAGPDYWPVPSQRTGGSSQVRPAKPVPAQETRKAG